MTTSNYQSFTVVGMGLDPIHVGTGGARLGRVDLSIVRDPVTQVPKIPGSSLAGVYRSYAALHWQEIGPQRQVGNQPKPYFPDCAGLGQPDAQGRGGHCGQPSCPICTVFGFASNRGGGFAGLAAFSDAHVLLFPVATREGPYWVTCPDALRQVGYDLKDELKDAFYCDGEKRPLNLGWISLEVSRHDELGNIKTVLRDYKLPGYIASRIGLLSDKLFSHVVNSNLEVRTSVSIDPSTGAAREGALFSYEALPRTTVLVWKVTCRNPKHFQIGSQNICVQVDGNKMDLPERVFEVAKKGHAYLKCLGIGGMGTRGMGRLWVLHSSAEAKRDTSKNVSSRAEVTAAPSGPASS
jgi:CRISPR-associated protein Cmr4